MSNRVFAVILILAIMSAGNLIRHEKLNLPANTENLGGKEKSALLPVQYASILGVTAVGLGVILIGLVKKHAHRRGGGKNLVPDRHNAGHIVLDNPDAGHSGEIDYRREIIEIYNSAVNYLQMEGIKKEAKTHWELYYAICERFDEKAAYFGRLTRLFEIARFSGYDVGRGEYEEARKLYESFVQS